MSLSLVLERQKQQLINHAIFHLQPYKSLLPVNQHKTRGLCLKKLQQKKVLLMQTKDFRLKRVDIKGME